MEFVHPELDVLKSSSAETTDVTDNFFFFQNQSMPENFRSFSLYYTVLQDRKYSYSYFDISLRQWKKVLTSDVAVLELKMIMRSTTIEAVILIIIHSK